MSTKVVTKNDGKVAMKAKSKAKKGKDVNKDLFEYVKANKYGRRQKVGVLYAAVNQDSVFIGASRVNLKKGDTFDLARGIQVAKGKALAGRCDYPLSLKKHLIEFEKRCHRYYKDKKVFGIVALHKTVKEQVIVQEGFDRLQDVLNIVFSKQNLITTKNPITNKLITENNTSK